MQRGIELHLIETPEFIYSTPPYQFEPNLSILDVLMWNSPKVVNEALRCGLIMRTGNTALKSCELP